jgi:membrane protein YqaA with SNARE-associated domain
MLLVSAHLSMFFAAFLAATPVPFQSEILLVTLLLADPSQVLILVIVASIGNTLGSVLTYWIGRKANDLAQTSRFHLSPQMRQKAENWFQKWGVWCLLLSWAPGGDALCAIAGALRLPMIKFITLVAIAKTSRYIAIAIPTVWITASFWSDDAVQITKAFLQHRG